MWLGLLIAALTLILFGRQALPNSFSASSASTAPGEQRTVEVSERTTVILNTNTRLTWTAGSSTDEVELLHGEALFKVAHDARQPVRVRVGGSEIRDLGTDFDVYRTERETVIVTVLSGEVAIEGVGRLPGGRRSRELRVKTGEQIEYTVAGVLLTRAHSVQANRTVGWRQGILETEGLSLVRVIEQLNRYSAKPIVIQDPHLERADIVVGGTLNITDIPAALKRLQKLVPMTIVETDSAYLLSYGTEHSASRSMIALAARHD